MEYMGGGCLTDVLDAHDIINMEEHHIAFVCQEVLFKSLASSDKTDTKSLGVYS